ncbi:MAG: hypothetical protein LBJ61_04985 [Deltaproteobacteria bacterium]|nr:hypothetical protein [Deltaproteobacteria bacterium]
MAYLFAFNIVYFIVLTPPAKAAAWILANFYRPNNGLAFGAGILTAVALISKALSDGFEAKSIEGFAYFTNLTNFTMIATLAVAVAGKPMCRPVGPPKSAPFEAVANPPHPGRRFYTRPVAPCADLAACFNAGIPLPMGGLGHLAKVARREAGRLSTARIMIRAFVFSARAGVMRRLRYLLPINIDFSI